MKINKDINKIVRSARNIREQQDAGQVICICLILAVIIIILSMICKVGA